VNSANIATMQLKSHFLLIHFIMETPIVSTHRNLSSVHPLHKLLQPHFKFHLAINAIGKDSLIAPTGLFVGASPFTYEGMNMVFNRSWQGWTWEDASFPGILKANGFSPDAKDAPPNYYFAHDGMALWKAIKSYVKGVVKIYYKDDEAVVNDFELQNWANDIYKGYGPSKNFPKSMTKKSDIVDVITPIIFQVSVMHATINFPQYESYSFIPNSPGVLFAPPPTKKGKLVLQDIFQALPPKGISARTIASLYMLSSYSSTDHMLGNFPEELFTKDCSEVKKEMEKFKKKLDGISESINKRGNWKHMLPEKIPNSTSI